MSENNIQNYIKARNRVIMAVKAEVKAKDESRKARHALLLAREALRQEEYQLLEDLEKI